MSLNFPSNPGIGQTYGFSDRVWTFNGEGWNLTPRELPQGSQGVQGTQGLQGLQGGGTQGSQGLQGLQGGGSQGTQGTQGLQGLQGGGTQGSQGLQGLQGGGSQGSQGSQGLQGLQGRQGSQGLQGLQGGGTQGTQGTQGSQGLQGLQGLQGGGTQGLQGSQGTQGSQGLQGLQGLSNQGSQGLQGLQGRQGSQGLQGLQGGGTQGLQGLQGRQGSQGLQGLQGLSNQGVQGSQGLQGLQGRQGSQGLQGLSNQGVQGLQGTQGIEGNNTGVPYTFSTITTDADPGNGTFRFDSSTVTAVTNVYIDNIDQLGNTQTGWYDTWDDSTSTIKGQLILRSISPTITTEVIFNVTGAVVVATGYYKIPVSFVSAGGARTNGMIFSAIFSRTGDLGTQGSQGTQGLSNQGVQGTQGLQGLQGRQGSQGLQGLSNQGVQGTQGPLSNFQGTQGTAGITPDAGGSGTFDTGITTSIYVSLDSGIGIGATDTNNIFTGPGIAYSFPSTAGKKYVIESIHIANVYTNELYLSGRQDYFGGSNVPIAQRVIVPYQGSSELLEEPIIASPSDILRFQALDSTSQTAAGVDGGLDAFIVYSAKDDTNYVGVGKTLGDGDGTEIFTSVSNPSVIQSIRIINYSLSADVDISVSIYRGGTVGGIITTGVRQGYLVYNLTIPVNSTIEICEKPKYLVAGDTIVGMGKNINNTTSICVSGKYIV